MQNLRNAARVFAATAAALVAVPAVAQTTDPPSAAADPYYNSPPKLVAQMPPPPPPAVVPPTQPVYATPAAEFGVAPRFWYLFSGNGFSRSQVLPNQARSAEDVNVPLAGGVLSARFASAPETTFLLSVLYGNGDSRATSVCAAIGATCNGAVRETLNKISEWPGDLAEA